MCQDRQGCPQPPEASRGEEEPSLEPAEETWPHWQLDFGLLAFIIARQQISVFRAPSLWSLAMAALGHLRQLDILFWFYRGK